MTMKRVTCFRDNKGLSLIELIVVIAIISILTVGTILGASVLGYGNAKGAAGRIKSLSDYTRLENMTKQEWYYLVIYQRDRSYYLCVQAEKGGDRIDKRTEKLDLRGGRITFHYTNGGRTIISTEPVEAEDTSGELELTYYKETGGIMKDINGRTVKSIQVECGRRSYNIHLVMATGKSYIE